MGNKNHVLPRNQVEEEEFISPPTQNQLLESYQLQQRVPLSQRSNSNTCQPSSSRVQKFSLQKLKKSEITKERPKLGQLKVKRVRETTKLNKENESEAVEVEHLNDRSKEVSEAPETKRQLNELKGSQNIQQLMLKTNDSEARTKKYRISKML